MLKFQILLIAVLVACFAFVSCERAQQIMTPVTDDMMDGSDSEMMDDTMMEDDMMDDGMMDDTMMDDMMDDDMMEDDMEEDMDDDA